MVGQTGSSALVRQLVWKENSEFNPVKLRLKNDLVSYPARAEGLGKYDNKLKRLMKRNKKYITLIYGLS